VGFSSLLEIILNLDRAIVGSLYTVIWKSPASSTSDVTLMLKHASLGSMWAAGASSREQYLRKMLQKYTAGSD
jgi:hypothetical protein